MATGGSDMKKPRRSASSDEERASDDSTGPFGTWVIGSDGLAHGLHDGKALCGARIDPVKASPLKATESTTIVMPLCKRCRALSAERSW